MIQLSQLYMTILLTLSVSHSHSHQEVWSYICFVIAGSYILSFNFSRSHSLLDPAVYSLSFYLSVYPFPFSCGCCCSSFNLQMLEFSISLGDMYPLFRHLTSYDPRKHLKAHGIKNHFRFVSASLAESGMRTLR